MSKEESKEVVNGLMKKVYDEAFELGSIQGSKFILTTLQNSMDEARIDFVPSEWIRTSLKQLQEKEKKLGDNDESNN